MPEPGQAAYIGDLRLAVEKSRFRFGVADRYDDALKKVEARLAEAKVEPVKALMQSERRLGEYKRTLGICAKDWGIECNRKLQGVEPVLPENTLGGFPTVSNLTPSFEWKPSTADGVAYDVAIYESLALAGFDSLPGAAKQRGRLAAYVEGLREPKFQLGTPLQPNKRYFWSVRLRNGDMVSGWSTSSYFAFFIVGWASGSGDWFGFTTPDSKAATDDAPAVK